MASVDFDSSARQIVDLVGGPENVVSVAHCITRVRFVLKDGKVATDNTERVKAVPGVIQVVEAGGQYQVVIGPKVERMYDAVVAITGEGAGEVPADPDQDKAEKGLADRLVSLISGVMLPVLKPLVGCGIVTCLLTILEMWGLVSEGTGTYLILHSIGQTCMYFFPVIIACSSAKYFGMDVYLGAVIGAALIYPDLVSAASDGSAVSFLGIPVSLIDYTSTVFPAIVSVWLASVVYKFMSRHTPSVISFVAVPFVTVIVSVPLALLVVGPVVNAASTAISVAMLAVYNFSPILCGAVLGGTWMLFIVPMGLHWGFIPIFMNNILTMGSEPMMGLLAGMTAVSGTCLAFGLRTKDVDTRSNTLSCAVTNLFGISEPGLYGVILQHKATILTTAIAGAVSGVLAALFHTSTYIMGGASGIFALPAYMNPDGSMESFIGAVLSMVVAAVVGFVLTMIWPFDPDEAVA